MASDLEMIREEIAALKAAPPRIDESPADLGHKLIRIADVLLRLADRLSGSLPVYSTKPSE